VQVGGDTAAPFQARRDDQLVEGYVWGKLTSRGLLQPLWLFLLPFTLVNVAGWMHPPDEDYRVRRLQVLPVLRFLVWVLGLLLTITYVLWLANVAINRLLAVETVFGWTPSRQTKIVAGTVVLLGLVGLHWVVARLVQKGFEGFRGPGRCPDRRGEASMLAQAGRVVVPESRGLENCRFWQHDQEARWLLLLHVVVGLAAAVLAGVWALAHADPESLAPAAAGTLADPTKARLQLGHLATLFTEGLLWILVLIGAVQFAGWRVSWRAEAQRFRILGSMTTGGLGVVAGTGFVYGLTVLVLGDPGRVGAIGVAFGMAALGSLVALAIGGVWLWAGKRRAVRAAKDPERPEYVPPQPNDEAGTLDEGRARELKGATPAMYNRIGWARSFSDGARNMDLPVSFVQLVFTGVGLLELRAGLRLEDMRYVGGLATLGHFLALSAAGGLLVFLVRRAYRPSQRRLVGILWDVFTFWPRRFHPLGVRPYAERAVPELQHRLVHHVDEHDRTVILSAHSQGTVIAFAALVQGDQVFDRVARRVALITYGSPLWQLYAMAFPAYFDRRGFDRLRKRLVGGTGPGSLAWLNFYRRTDYIGKEVFGNELDVEVDDPAREPTASTQPKRPWPDPPRTPWIDLDRHSFYNNETKLKKEVASLRRKLSGTRAMAKKPQVRGRSRTG
jgi:hypothetical protein